MGLATIKIEGLQELFNKFEEVEETVDGRKVNTAFLNSADVLLKAQQKEAPKDTRQGLKDLKVGKVKRRKGYKHVKVGLEYGNWTYGSTNENHGARGIWYQHWGYTTRGGRFIQGSFWMDDAFEKSQDKAAKTLISGINQAINEVWK